MSFDTSWSARLNSLVFKVSSCWKHIQLCVALHTEYTRWLNIQFFQLWQKTFGTELRHQNIKVKALSWTLERTIVEFVFTATQYLRNRMVPFLQYQYFVLTNMYFLLHTDYADS